MKLLVVIKVVAKIIWSVIAKIKILRLHLSTVSEYLKKKPRSLASLRKQRENLMAH